MSSANDKFRIWITGKGCHGSAPQNGADALLAGASLVQTLQTVISRESDPLKPTVMTVGIFESGTAFNILPENAYIEGSIRVLEEEQRLVNRRAIERMAEASAQAYRCTAKVEFEATAKVVYNDSHLTDLAVRGGRGNPWERTCEGTGFKPWGGGLCGISGSLPGNLHEYRFPQ